MKPMKKKDYEEAPEPLELPPLPGKSGREHFGGPVKPIRGHYG